jgi:hypothetical protein
MLPGCQKVTEFCDVFCEEKAFNLESQKILEQGRDMV